MVLRPVRLLRSSRYFRLTTSCEPPTPRSSSRTPPQLGTRCSDPRRQSASQYSEPIHRAGLLTIRQEGRTASDTLDASRVVPVPFRRPLCPAEVTGSPRAIPRRSMTSQLRRLPEA